MYNNTNKLKRLFKNVGVSSQENAESVLQLAKSLNTKEKCELEQKCDNLLKQALGEYCEISMALTSKLKVTFDDGFSYVTINNDFNSICYIKYTGDYSNLKYTIRQILACVKKHENDFRLLLESYK